MGEAVTRTGEGEVDRQQLQVRRSPTHIASLGSVYWCDAIETYRFKLVTRLACQLTFGADGG